MRPLFLVSLAVMFGACTRAAPAGVDAGAAPDSCTFETKLVPGIPGSPGHLIASERNPNGASELATLMRTFVDDWKAARGAVESNTTPAKYFSTHRQLRCAWPTDLADRNVTFDGYAKNYLTAVKGFDAQPGREKYEAVLDACKACHEVSCGGPLEVIEGLRWK